MNNGQIYLVESDNRQELAETFMRFQEFYESPVFGGRSFSVDEFASWYSQQHGAFSYAQDWAGFNIPSKILEPFKNGNFDPLTGREQRLIDFFRKDAGNSYIIGVTSEDEWRADTLRHEFAHGAYFVNEEYRKSVNDFLRNKKVKTASTLLSGMGYGENVIEDETNAYLLTEPQTLMADRSMAGAMNLRDMLDNIFYKHFRFSMVNVPLKVIMSRVKNFLL